MSALMGDHARSRRESCQGKINVGLKLKVIAHWANSMLMLAVHLTWQAAAIVVEEARIVTFIDFLKKKSYSNHHSPLAALAVAATSS